MTTPQQINGDIIDPDQWTGRVHPSITDPTMTERKRCLAWVDRQIDINTKFLERMDDSTQQRIMNAVLLDLQYLRARITNGDRR